MLNRRELTQMARTMTGRQVCDILEQNFEASRQGKPGFLKPSDFSIKDLYEAFVGNEALNLLDPRNVTEASEAVDSTTFLSIAETVVSAEVLAAYERMPFSIGSLFPVRPSRSQTEHLVGIYDVATGAREVPEGMPFPHTGLEPTQIETPKTTKRGLIIAVTKEAIFFDQTSQILERASNVGEALKIAEEIEAVDLLVGATNNYNWDGTSYNTYQASTPWINDLQAAAADLIDWTDLDQAEALFLGMKDPQGQPIAINPTHLIASAARKNAIAQVLTGVEVRKATDSGNTITIGSNPVTTYQTVYSIYLHHRLIANGATADQAKATWFLGNPAKAFGVMENWPLTVVQAPPNSEAEFNQDIVARFKASSRRKAFVRDPRYMVRVRGYAP